MQELLDTMRRLRAPDGCPWDREQTHESLRPYLLEEAAEAVDAISAGTDAEIVGELGDVLLQVAFHAVIAEQDGRWTYEDVQGAIVSKLIRRHPHVFSDVKVTGSDEVVTNWQAIKAQEKAQEGAGRERSPLHDIPSALGALAREAQAQKVTGEHKLPEPEARERVLRAAREAIPSEEGVGDLLAAVVAWARSAGVDPEVTLRAHTARRDA